MALVDKRDCFLISPIGPPDSPIRRRADTVFTSIIEPVLTRLGYRGVRADHIKTPGLITNQMIAYLAEASVVIADLTGHNPNVFYELAVRHALNKPIVQMIEEGQSIPFDVAGTRTIYFSTEGDAAVDRARADLEGQIRAVEAGAADHDTPLSIGLRSLARNSREVIGTLGQAANMPNIQYFRNVNEVYDALYACCEGALSRDGRVLVKNIGLDWETTWPRFRYDLLDKLRFAPIELRCLLIDPDDERICRHCTDVVSADIARITQGKIKAYINTRAGALRSGGVRFEIRAYGELPVVHGFTVNERHLFMSFTKPGEQGLTGGDEVYHYCLHDPGNHVIANYLSVFDSWFELHWRGGKTVARSDA